MLAVRRAQAAVDLEGLQRLHRFVGRRPELPRVFLHQESIDRRWIGPGMFTRQAVETHLASALVGKAVRAVRWADALVDGSVRQVVSETAKLGLPLAQRLLRASALRDVDEGDASRGRTLPLHHGGGGLHPEAAPVLP